MWVMERRCIYLAAGAWTLGRRPFLRFDFGVPLGVVRASFSGGTPSPLFSEVRILKELWTEMLEVRSVKGLREGDFG